MKVLLQRVSRAAVRIRGERVGEISRGLVVFLAAERNDTPRHADYFADKVAGLRVFPDGQGRMNRSLLEVGGEALVVSQFTLAGSTRRGRRPSFTDAAPAGEAEALYRRFVEQLEARGVRRVATGVFQAYMEVEILNDGPVTILLDPPPWQEEP